MVAAGLWGRAVKKGRFSCSRLHGLSASYPCRCLEDNQTLCISAVMQFAYRKSLETASGYPGEFVLPDKSNQVRSAL